MIFSAQQLFSDDQVVNTTEGSTNVLDLGAPGTPYGAAGAIEKDIGKGTAIPILVQVTGAITGTLTVTIQTDNDEGFGSATDVASYSFGASAAAGDQMAIQVLPNQIAERYLRLEYSGATAGTVTAGITMGNQTNG